MPRLLLLLSVFLAGARVSGAADWPQFLGPDRTGISQEAALNLDWSAKEPAVLWRASVKLGVSSCIIVGDRLYTMGKDGENDLLHCLEAKTGKKLWTQSYRCKFTTRSYEGGCASTPTHDGGRLYTMSNTGQVCCWSAQDGKQLWRVKLMDDFGAERIKWGWAESPLVVGAAVIVQAGAPEAGLVALDKLTGKLLWKHGGDKTAYASGRAFTYRGKQAVLFFNDFGLVASAPDTGEELWRQEWRTDFGVNASLPLWDGGTGIFLASGYGRGSAVVDVSGDAPKFRWENKEMFLHFQNSVLVNGHVFGVSGDNRGNTKGTLKCLDFATGAVRWSEGIGETYGQVLVVAGKLLILTDQGEIVMVEATPDSYKELNRMQVLGGARAWGVPAFANGLLYVRQNQGEMACVDLNP